MKIHMLDTKHIPQYVPKCACNRQIIKVTLHKGPDTVQCRLYLGFPYSTFLDKSSDNARLISNYVHFT
jgi:hypothetical protein